MSGRSSAPVESITRGESIDSDGMRRRREPVARITCSTLTVSSPPSAFFTLSVVRIDDRRPALEVVDLAELRQLAGAARQLLDDAVLVVAQLVEVDLRLAELDAPVLGVLRLVDQLGDVQQRLRRNAAAIEADAAGILLVVDERDLQPRSAA